MSTPPLRFALIGAGHIAQSAVLPAFAAIPRRARLTALLSDDATKRRKLARTYGIASVWSEAELPEALASGVFDALYIATPNHLHLQQATRALAAGIHVLLEKPMTLDTTEARSLATAARRSRAALMVAYRLHCDPLYVEALRLVADGTIGEPRIFNASFTMQLRPGDVRSHAALGGGSVPDLGIYCINAARTVFGSEPLEVRAQAVRGHDRRSREVDEMTAAILRFPGDRLATFTSSFDGAPTSWFQVIGTTGSLCLDAAFDESGEMELTVERAGRTRRKTGRIGDQFAAEIAYFADCVRNGRRPEPGVEEGLRDVRVIAAVIKAAAGRAAVTLPPLPRKRGPQPAMTRRVHTPARKPPLVRVASPSVGD